MKNQNYIKKTSVFIAVFVSIIFLTGCFLEDDPTPKTGTVTFWNYDKRIGNITVVVNGSYKTIDSDVSPIDCNTSGCANFYLNQGTYSFSATATTGEKWSGTLTLSSSCLMFNLY